MLSYDDHLRQDFKDLHINITSMTLPDIKINLFKTIGDSIGISKLNNPDYLPQDFVNEIETKIQHYFKKHQSKFTEVIFPNGNKFVGEVTKEKKPNGMGLYWIADGDRYEG
jgi:hypothetical protein